LFGYSGLGWDEIKGMLALGKSIPIPSTTVINGGLAVRLEGQKLIYGYSFSTENQALKRDAIAFANKQWGKKLIDARDIINVCTMYLMNVENGGIVKRGYIGTNADLEWLKPKKTIKPDQIDEMISFASDKKYAYLELRDGIIASHLKNASFSVAFYCAKCGRHISLISNVCDCGAKFAWEPSDFEICLSCRDGFFEFDLTPKMRQVFESQGWTFKQLIQGN
jgi:hypothetical protein